MKVYVTPSEAWQFFEESEGMEFITQTLAEDFDAGVEIAMVSHYGQPNVMVLIDGEPFVEDVCCDAQDLRETLENYYDEYLSGDDVDELELDPLTDEEFEIMAREEELSAAFYDLLDVILGRKEEGHLNGALCEELKDLVCEHLAKEHSLAIYRPMFLEDENGEEFFEEYPYDCMDL